MHGFDCPLSVAQLADRWACSRDAVYALIKSGQLPHFKAGGKLLRIKLADVVAWENGGARSSSEPIPCNGTAMPPALSCETAPVTVPGHVAASVSASASSQARREARLLRELMRGQFPRST